MAIVADRIEAGAGALPGCRYAWHRRPHAEEVEVDQLSGEPMRSASDEMSTRRRRVGDLALVAGERRDVGALVDGALAPRSRRRPRRNRRRARSAGGPRRLQ
jgi:hypothetical protein